jgi:glutamate N-acetyltransferase/amino-acid N-acetyltransferase
MPTAAGHQGGAFAPINGGVTAPLGFSAGSAAAGIKKAGRLDVALLVADADVPCAAVYTTNTVAAAPVVVSRNHTAHGHVRAAVINSGNANACTGPQGVADARAMADAVGSAIGCPSDEVVVSSTGVIGVPLPMPKVLAGIAAAAAALSPDGGDEAAEAIRTTDTFVKQCAIELTLDGTTYRVGGMAKGSGMIQPNMATMLAFVTTDAPLTSGACDAMLRSASDRTFNRITVDSDTSTNDMCLLLASGAAGGEPVSVHGARFDALAAAVHHVCGELARMIVRDGEGATKFVEITVQGALCEADAERAAFAIANSPLCKTAIFGGDANWGRVAMAIGKSGAQVDPDAFDIVFAGIPTCVAGTAIAFDEDAAAEALSLRDVDVLVDLHVGDGEATVWTCDLSYEYVRINGEYRS